MEQFTVKELGERTFIVTDVAANARSYVVLGAERAIVIDTGSGVGNIREFIEKLIGTDMAVFCAVTRISEDTLGGALLFDEVYYMGGKGDKGLAKDFLKEVAGSSYVQRGIMVHEDHFHLGGVHVGIWEAPGPWRDRACIRMTREGVFTATFAGDYLEFADELIEKYGPKPGQEETSLGDHVTVRDVKFGRKDMVIYAEGIGALAKFIDKEELVYGAHTDDIRNQFDLAFMERMLKNIAHRIGNPAETTGKGDLIEICEDVVVKYNPRNGVDELEIPEGVVGIAGKVFFQSNLYRVKFPSTLKFVGDGAFDNARSLVEAKLPDGFEHFGERSFASTGLEKVYIPPKITSMPTGVFDGCMGYEELVVPGTVKKIGDLCFSANRRVKSVVIEEGVEEIGRRTFNGNPDLKNLYFPRSIKSVKPYAFDGSGAPEAVTISYTTKEVWKESFCGNKGIKDVIIEEGIETIGVRAFAYCSNLEKITLPSTIKKIQFRAFSGCVALKEIRLPECAEIEELAFEACPAKIIRF